MEFSKFARRCENTPDLGFLGPSDCVIAVAVCLGLNCESDLPHDRAKRASGAYWCASGAPPFGAGERGRIKNIWGCRSMRGGVRDRALAPDVFYSASFARKLGSHVSERREGQLPAETIGQFLPSAWRYPYRCVYIELKYRTRCAPSPAATELLRGTGRR